MLSGLFADTAAALVDAAEEHPPSARSRTDRHAAIAAPPAERPREAGRRSSAEARRKAFRAGRVVATSASGTAHVVWALRVLITCGLSAPRPPHLTSRETRVGLPGDPGVDSSRRAPVWVNLHRTEDRASRASASPRRSSVPSTRLMAISFAVTEVRARRATETCRALSSSRARRSALAPGSNRRGRRASSGCTRVCRH